MSLELKKFDMKSIQFKATENKGPVVVLIGKRDTGKSFLVRDLLYYQQEIPIGTVISGLLQNTAKFKILQIYQRHNS
jgi:ABC-type polar amino acid transport system ATPase subunit